jgi:hypothetical protein
MFKKEKQTFQERVANNGFEFSQMCGHISHHSCINSSTKKSTFLFNSNGRRMKIIIFFSVVISLQPKKRKDENTAQLQNTIKNTSSHKLKAFAITKNNVPGTKFQIIFFFSDGFFSLNFTFRKIAIELDICVIFPHTLYFFELSKTP